MSKTVILPNILLKTNSLINCLFLHILPLTVMIYKIKLEFQQSLMF